MEEQKQLTPIDYLKILNANCDNAISSSCGKEENKVKWNMQEVSSVINCINNIHNALLRLEELEAIEAQHKLPGKDNEKK